MSSGSGRHEDHYLEQVCLHAVGALPADEVPALERHLAACADCRQELEALRPVVQSFATWPTDVLRPAEALWARLASRVGADATTPPSPAAAVGREPQWREAAPGVFCKVLSTDEETDRVSMLVRLAPGASYPPHRHADVEELFLLDGVLTIDDRTLHPGDYSRAEPGSADAVVRSDTGCTCVLVTSGLDELR